MTTSTTKQSLQPTNPNPSSSHQSSTLSPTNPDPTATTTASTSTTTTTIPTKPSLTVHPTALIHDKSLISGSHPITLGPGCIIHPFARLDSSCGPIEVGEGAVIWEKCLIGAAPSTESGKGAVGDVYRERVGETAREWEEGKGNKTIIGSHTHISPHATIHANTTLGSHSTVEVAATVGCGPGSDSSSSSPPNPRNPSGAQTRIGSHTKIGTCCAIPSGAMIADFMTVYLMGERQCERVNRTLREEDGVREMSVVGRERKRVLLGRVVRGGGKWRV